MVVVCQKCRTRFQLDEARIPAKGVRVRCSKCKHAFLVAPPANEDSTLHRLAEQAAATGRPAKAKPGPQLDLPGPGKAEAERFSAAAAAAGESEDDWEFNTDSPGAGGELGAGDDTTPPPAEITDSEPTEMDDGESFFELDGLRDPGPEGSQEGSARRGEPAAHAAAASQRLREAEPPSAAAPKPASPKSAPAKPAAKAPAPQPTRSKGPIEPEQEVGFEDLGNPDSWEFGIEAKRSEPAKPAKAIGSKRKAPEPAQVEAAPPARARASAQEIAAGRTGAVVSAAAWLIAFSLFGLGLRGVLSPGEAVAHIPATAIGALEVSSLQVRHVENFWAGPLVVVAGELRNPGSSAAKAGAVPRLRVRDAEGAAVELSAPWLGAELPERALREDDPTAIGAALERSARTLAERSLEPQESVRVQAVLLGLRSGAGDFTVEGAPLTAAPEAAPVEHAAPPAEAPAPEPAEAQDPTAVPAPPPEAAAAP